MQNISFSDFLSLMRKVQAGYKVEVCPADTPEDAFPVPCHRFYTNDVSHVVVYRPANLDGGV